MKKLFVAALAAVCTLGVSAQRASDSSSISLWDSESVDQKVILGVRAGMNFSNISFSADEIEMNLDSKIGFKVGVSADFPIVSSIYINSGLFYSVKGAKGEEYDGGRVKSTITAGYLELPVYASYRLNFAEESQLQINFGPYFAYGLNGKAKDEYTVDGVNVSEKWDLFGTDEDQFGFKRFDMGLGVGTGYSIGKFYFGFEYQFGLVNLADKKDWEDDVNIKNSNFNISIGYNF